MNCVELQQREQAASAGRVALLGLGEAGGRLAAPVVESMHAAEAIGHRAATKER